MANKNELSEYIHHGTWINWTQGDFICGATLTISTSHAGILSSFIATFITIVGVQLWKIIAFAIHQLKSSSVPKDGLFHQQQAIWRNTSGPAGAAWIWLQQAWFWRFRTKRSLTRTICWAIFAIVYLFHFALAAIFSAEISKAPGRQRLLKGDACTVWVGNRNISSPLEYSANLEQIQNQIVEPAAVYARTCYGTHFDVLQCSRYPVSSILWTSSEDAACPFQPHMCLHGNRSAFQMATNIIDSHTDAGINSPKTDRVQVQKQMTCAVIAQKGFTKTMNRLTSDQDGTPYNETYVNYMYGSSDQPGGGRRMATLSLDTRIPNSQQDYQLSSLAHSPGGIFQWNPIPGLARDDADLTLLFLSAKGMTYQKSVDDPWFRAQKKLKQKDGTFLYTTEHYSSVLGCAEQYRYCNPTTEMCSEFTAAGTILQDGVPANMGFNNAQNLALARIFTTFKSSGLMSMVQTRQETALLAREKKIEASLEGLPSNQWQLELSSWFDTSLASFQQIMLYPVFGSNMVIPGAERVNLVDGVTRLNVSRTQHNCRNQMINDSWDTVSFSILGLVILFTVGGTVIFISLVIERLVGLLQVCFEFNLHGRKAWVTDDKLQMQKSLFEACGIGEWELKRQGSIPITVKGDLFCRYDPRELESVLSPTVSKSSNDTNGSVCSHCSKCNTLWDEQVENCNRAG